MKNNVIAWIIGVAAVLIILVMTSVTRSPVKPVADAGAQNEVNLALREVADHLLRETKDFRTLIPPIRTEGEDTYLIKLATQVDYFSLRSTIDSILTRHGIRPDYRVSLLNCASGQIDLGFLALASDQNKEVPCQEREQVNDCYNVRLSLIDQHKAIAGSPSDGPMPKLPWLWVGLVIGFPLIWLFWKRQPLQAEAGNSDNDGWFSMSDITTFHPANQLLNIEETSQELTFREAKLLQFFFEHKNQVLERERIMEAVWEDEGVIVGRSLDVFVSRLRKKLKGDPALQITNVHGVGYKLMIG